LFQASLDFGAAFSRFHRAIENEDLHRQEFNFEKAKKLYQYIIDFYNKN